MEEKERKLIELYIKEKKYIFFEDKKNEIDWPGICFITNLTEEFVTRFINKLDLDKILLINQFSEAFFLQHKNKLNWSYISFVQKLSDEFIMKNLKLLDTEMLLFNTYVSQEIKTKIIELEQLKK
jgi:hypothetical protein